MLYQKLQSQSASYFAQRRSGDLLARLTADVESVQDVLIRGTDSVVANGLRVLGVVSAMAPDSRSGWSPIRCRTANAG